LPLVAHYGAGVNRPRILLVGSLTFVAFNLRLSIAAVLP